MADSNGIQLTQPRIAPGSSPSKKRPDGKDALLTEKPPPLETKISSPHKSGAFCGRTSSARCCISYTPLLSILGILLVVVGTALYGQEGKEALHSLQQLLVAASGPGSDWSKLTHAYRSAWIATVVIAALAAAFVICVLLWRVGQRLKAEGRVGKGFATQRNYTALEWVTVILTVIVYAFCAWVAIWFAINLLAFVGVLIAEMVAQASIKLFNVVVPILRGWLNDSVASYAALEQLLSQNPAIGNSSGTFVDAAFSALVPTPNDIATFINQQTGNKFSYLVGSLLNPPPVIGANGQRICARSCIDLTQYSFMKSSACICNSPILKSVAVQAGDARMHFLRALIGLVLLYLGASLLLSRLSAEAAKIRYDLNLLWTNKFDRLIMRRAKAGENNTTTLGQASSMRAPSPQASPARGSGQYPSQYIV